MEWLQAGCINKKTLSFASSSRGPKLPAIRLHLQGVFVEPTTIFELGSLERVPKGTKSHK